MSISLITSFFSCRSFYSKNQENDRKLLCQLWSIVHSFNTEIFNVKVYYLYLTLCRYGLPKHCFLSGHSCLNLCFWIKTLRGSVQESSMLWKLRAIWPETPLMDNFLNLSMGSFHFNSNLPLSPVWRDLSKRSILLGSSIFIPFFRRRKGMFCKSSMNYIGLIVWILC